MLIYVKYSINNLSNSIKKPEDVNLKNANVISVKKKIINFDYLQKKQYELLPDTVKNLFETGNLNPGLLQYYVDFSFRNSAFNDPNHPATRSAISKMNTDIKDMKALCDENDCKMVFINMPTPLFTGHKV